MWWKNKQAGAPVKCVGAPAKRVGAPIKCVGVSARHVGASEASAAGKHSGAGRLNLVLLALMLGFASLCMSGCGVDDIDISSCADETITLAGVTEEDITLTVADLKAMECITKKTESTSDKIGRVRATGPTLDTVLRQYGMTQAEVKKVHIYARDDYDVKLDERVLADNDIILAFGMEGKPLSAEDAPVRIIIPESDSAYWIRMVERIELED